MYARIAFLAALLGLLAWVAVLDMPDEPPETAARNLAATPDPAQDPAQVSAEAARRRGTDDLSAAEKVRLGYIRLSLMERENAYALSDTGRPFAQVIAADEERERAMWERTERAYDYARMASQSDLATAHPDLPGKWRNLYQEGMRLRLRGYREAGSMQQNIMNEFKGVELLNKFWAWWRQNRGDVKLPKTRS